MADATSVVPSSSDSNTVETLGPDTTPATPSAVPLSTDVPQTTDIPAPSNVTDGPVDLSPLLTDFSTLDPDATIDPNISATTFLPTPTSVASPANAPSGVQPQVLLPGIPAPLYTQPQLTGVDKIIDGGLNSYITTYAGPITLVSVVLTVALAALFTFCMRWRRRGIQVPKESGAMRFAASQGKLGALKGLQRLAPTKFDPNMAIDGFTPLHAAAVQGHAAVAEWLLLQGANPHMCKNDEWKDSPLHYAAAGGHHEAAMVLLAYGADPMAENFEGAQPADLAERAGFLDLAKTIRTWPMKKAMGEELAGALLDDDENKDGWGGVAVKKAPKVLDVTHSWHRAALMSKSPNNNGITSSDSSSPDELPVSIRLPPEELPLETGTADEGAPREWTVEGHLEAVQKSRELILRREHEAAEEDLRPVAATARTRLDWDLPQLPNIRTAGVNTGVSTGVSISPRLTRRSPRVAPEAEGRRAYTSSPLGVRVPPAEGDVQLTATSMVMRNRTTPALPITGFARPALMVAVESGEEGRDGVDIGVAINAHHRNSSRESLLGANQTGWSGPLRPERISSFSGILCKPPRSDFGDYEDMHPTLDLIPPQLADGKDDSLDCWIAARRPRLPSWHASTTYGPPANDYATTDEVQALLQRAFEGYGSSGTHLRPRWRWFQLSATVLWVFNTVYMVWRALRSFNPGNVAMSVIFYLAECLFYMANVITLFLLNWFAIERDSRNLDQMVGLSEEEYPSVDVLIPCYSEPLDVIEGTVVAAMRIEYPPNRLMVHVCDDGRRAEVKAMARRLELQRRQTKGMRGGPLLNYIARPKVKGVNHHYKAGNINHAVLKAGLSGDLLLVFDSDMMAKPQFLRRAVGHFFRPRTGGGWERKERAAFLQVPQDFYNLSGDDLFYSRTRFYYGPILQSMDGMGCAPCVGTGVLFNREALVAIGGQAYGSITEDYNTAMELHNAGFGAMALNEFLVCGLAPTDVHTLFQQRLRWAMGSLQILIHNCPLFKPGLTGYQAIIFFQSATAYLLVLPSLACALLPLIIFFTGSSKSPVLCSVQELAAFFLPFFFLLRVTYYLGHYKVPDASLNMWRGIQQWLWLMPTNLTAMWKVISSELNLLGLCGCGGKLGFKVTRKDGEESIWEALSVVWPFLAYYVVYGVGVSYNIWRIVTHQIDIINIGGELVAFVWGTQMCLAIWPPVKGALPWYKMKGGYVLWRKASPNVFLQTSAVSGAVPPRNSSSAALLPATNTSLPSPDVSGETTLPSPTSSVSNDDGTQSQPANSATQLVRSASQVPLQEASNGKAGGVDYQTTPSLDTVPEFRIRKPKGLINYMAFTNDVAVILGFTIGAAYYYFYITNYHGWLGVVNSGQECC